MSNSFWEHIGEYSRLGFDPLLWLTRGSNEIDLPTKISAASGIHKAGLKFLPSWFDPYFYIEGKVPEVTRRTFGLGETSSEKEVGVKRALALFRLQQLVCEESKRLAEVLDSFFKPFANKLSLSCISVSATTHDDAQFGVLDYIELHRGDKAGYMPAVNAITSATDVSAAPDAELHSSIAMTSCIDTLNILGCGVNSSFKLFPIYDSPSEGMLDKIRSNLDTYACRYNLAWEDYSSLKRGKLVFGSSAMATTTKELPVKYDQVQEGMEIMLTNKMGGLTSLSLKTVGNMNSDNINKFEKDGLRFSDIEASSQAAIKNLSEPHFALGKIISKYCPDFETPIDKSTHITAVMPVGPHGVSSISHLADQIGCQLVINEIPIVDPALSAYATKEFLVEDSTASLNGCHLIVASKDALNLVEAELSKHNFSPSRIGFVGKKGQPSVAIDRATVEKLVSSVKKMSMIFEPRPKGPETPPAAPSTPS